MKIITIIACIILVAGVVLSQDETVRVETNLVTLNVSVVDGRGRGVKGLTKYDFVVLDNGVGQNIESFSLHDAPVSLGVIYDLHHANDEQTRSILAALRAFSDSLGTTDDLFVNVIGEKGSLVTDFVPSEIQVRDNVLNGDKNDNNSLYDAIFQASRKLSTARNQKRFLILVTDGTDSSSHHSLKELRAHLRAVNLPVYSITFGRSNRLHFGYSDIHQERPSQGFALTDSNELDRAVIEELSKATGGESFEGEVRNRIYLTALFSRVFESVREQYVLGFYPEKLDGKQHKLNVSVMGPKARGYKVAHRTGYQVRK